MLERSKPSKWCKTTRAERERTRDPRSPEPEAGMPSGEWTLDAHIDGGARSCPRSNPRQQRFMEQGGKPPSNTRTRGHSVAARKRRTGTRPGDGPGTRTVTRSKAGSLKRPLVHEGPALPDESGEAGDGPEDPRTRAGNGEREGGSGKAQRAATDHPRDTTPTSDRRRSPRPIAPHSTECSIHPSPDPG